MKLKHLLELSFVEVTDTSEEVISEKTGDVALNVKMKWQQGGVINNNKRRYRTELFQKEVDRLLPMCQEGRVYGGAYHPSDGKDVEIPSAAVIWKNLSVEKDGSCIGEAKIMPTRVGKDAQAIIKSGGRIGISSRGFGTVTQKTEVIDGKMQTFSDVNDDFKLKTPGDLVLTPSVADTGPIQEQLEESFNTFYNKSVSNKVQDLQNNDVGEKMKLKELKEKHSELVKELEDEFKASTQKETEKDTWKKEVEKQVDEKIKPLQDEVTTLKTEKDSVVESLKSAVETFVKSSKTFKEGIDVLSKIPGVLPETEGTDKPKTEDKIEVDNSKLEKKVDDLEKANKDLTKKIEDAQADVTLQGKLKETLNAELEKEGNAVYRALIEKKLITDGRILIEKEGDVEEAVKSAKQDVNDTLAEAKKAKIINANLDEVGKVEDPEGNKKIAEKELLEARFDEAVTSGFKGNIDDFKKITLTEKE